MNYLSKHYLHLTVFVVGAVILVLEILGTRIIAPYYGTTIYVWSSLIGVTLMALALGYHFGGRISDKRPDHGGLYLIVFLAALSVLLIPLTMNAVLVETNFLGPRYGALFSGAILFGLPLFLLGMISPYAMKLKAKDMRKLGITAGNLYGLGTIGSFVGAIAAGFYFIPNMGINSITYVLAGALVLLAAPYGFRSKRKLFFAGLGLMIFMVSIMPYVTSVEVNEDFRIVYETEGVYSRLKVVDYSNLRYLLVDGATHTRYNLKDGSFSFGYLGMFEKAVKYHSDPKDVLVIGLGGGGIDKKLEEHDLNIDNVEIDSEIARIAREYFGFEGEAVIDDGRHYIRNTDKKYDIVYLDVYSGYSIYPYLFSREAFVEIRDILNDDGILVVNSLGYEDGHSSSDDALILAIGATLRDVFPNVYVKSRGYGLTNFVFYATTDKLELDSNYVSVDVPFGGIVVTDDYNPVERLSLNAVEEWRNSNVGRFGNEIVS